MEVEGTVEAKGEAAGGVPETKEPEEVHPLVLQVRELQRLVEEESRGAASIAPRVGEVLSDPSTEDGALRAKESAMYLLGKLLCEARDLEGLKDLLFSNVAYFNAIPKAKTAKIVRTILDMLRKVPDSLQLQLTLTMAVMKWCVQEKRTFLRHRVQAKYANLQYQLGDYQSGLRTTTALLRELKKLDDKQLLVDTYLVEAKLHHALRNVPKSKASLTASRTAAHAVYISPVLQAELDEMSGKLYCEEGDYSTSYSYFLEAFEAYDQGGDDRAMDSLKHMLLCKILSGKAGEVGAMLNGKKAVKYDAGELEGLVEIAAAAKKRSLDDFKVAQGRHAEALGADVLIAHHVDVLYEQMLEANLLKIIEPFSSVELDYVASLIHLPVEAVERKLSVMVLDGKLNGTLDQGRGTLMVYEGNKEDKAFTNGLRIIDNMDAVVSSLFRRAHKLEA